MNKKEFLNKLEIKLFILDDAERNDIINEYSDIIDEKVKHGKTEAEAILDFGSIDLLAKEILGAYKINPDFNEKKKDDETFNDFLSSADKFIRKTASQLSDFTKDLVNKYKDNNHDITIEAIFEIIIKAVILMFVLLIPFSILRGFGLWISDAMIINPLNHIIYMVWQVLIGSLYFIACILVVSSVLKEVLGRSEIRKDKKKETKKVTKKTKKDTKEEMNTDEPVTKENHSDIAGIVVTIFKVIVILWTIPLIFATGASYVLLAILVYGLIKGLEIYGFILLAIGGTMLLSGLLDVIYGLLFNRKKVHIYPFIIALVVIIIGALFTTEYVLNLKYHNHLPVDEYKLTVEKFEKDVRDQVEIVNYMKYNDIKIDNNLADNKIIIEVSYYKDYETIFIDKNQCQDSSLACDQYYISQTPHGRHFELVNDFIDNLKHHEVYNYRNLFKIKIRVIANQNTINKLK